MIGFVGLGRMGQGMASNLFRRCEEEVMVFDTSPEAVATLASIGAIAASSIEELTRSSTVVFTSLPGPPQVEEVVFGPGGILDNLQPGFVLFDMSTNSLSLQRRIYDAFALRGAAMLDAPVSGGPAGATSGDLAIWVGGAKDLYERHLLLLRSIGDKPRYVGGLGAGTVTKLSHNMLGYMIMLPAPVGVHDLAVQDQVRHPLGQGPLQLLLQTRRAGRDHLDHLIEIPVCRGLRQPETRASRGMSPLSRNQASPNSAAGSSPAAGPPRPDLAAVRGQQPGNEQDQPLGTSSMTR